MECHTIPWLAMFFFAEVVHVFGNFNCGFFAMVFFLEDFWGGPWGLESKCSMGVE